MINKCRKLFFVRKCDLKSLLDALDLVSQSLNILSGLEDNIRNRGVEIPVALFKHTDLY